MVQFTVGFADQIACNQEGEDIRHGHGVQHTVQPEEPGQQQGKAHTEHHLTHHGQGGGFCCLAHGLQKDEAGLVDTGQNNHAQVDAEGAHCKIGVVNALVGGTEQGDELPENPSLKDIGYVLGVQPFDCTPFYNASLDFADKTVKNFNFLFSGAIFMLDSFVNENLFNQSI